MTGFCILPVPIDRIPVVDYGNEEFIEIHLDERFNVGENFQLCKVWKKNDTDAPIIEKNYRIFHDVDQCINFIISYQWRKVFLTLTDHYSHLLELIHDLPQIVYFYIYSISPETVKYKIEIYPKLRIIVHENSPDADKQLLEDIDMFRRDLMPMNVVKPIKRKTKLLIEDGYNLDEYSIVWLQDQNNCTTIDTSIISNIMKSCKIFFNSDQSIEFIKSSPNTNIFFIISNPNDDGIVEKISHYLQVISIYIFQTQTELSTISHPKLRGIYSDIEKLSEELSKENELHQKYSSTPLSVFHREKNEKTIRDLSKDNVKFLWFQLLIDILIKIPYNDQAKDEMLYVCRKNFGIPCQDDEDNDENLLITMTNYTKRIKKDILEFEQNYKATEALKFYTADSFFYRLFNQAFRTENIDIIFLFRFFLADLYKQLQKLYDEQFPNSLPPTVYRGQFMTKREFDNIKHNVGQLISINTFFSTTIDRDVAKIFAGYVTDPNSDILSVLFHIGIDLDCSGYKRPFGLLGGMSKMADEYEVIFSMGSTFRIESVENNSRVDECCYVKLKLVQDDDDIKEFRNELEKEYCVEGDLCSLGQVLWVMGDYERAERYFLMLLEYLPRDHPERTRVYISLGMNARNKGDHQTSLSYHQKALEIYKKPSIYDYQEDIGQIYVNIAGAHQRLGNLDLAMKYMKMATDIQKSPESLSYTYNQLAMLYRDKGDKCLALEYFQKTLHIEEEVLRTNKYKPVLATMYNNIGEIYSQLGDYDNALKHLHHALDIRLKGTVSTHTDLAAIYTNLGSVYHKKKEFKKALEVLEKAFEIDTQTFGNNHESLAVTHNNISAVYRDMNNFNRALYHLRTALRILLRSQAGEKHLNIDKIQYNIGILQLQLGNNDKALKITQKALNNQLKRLPENHEKFAHTYLLLSLIYRKKNDKKTALEYMEKGLEIARISILPHNKSLFHNFQMKYDMLKNDNSCVDGLGIRDADDNFVCFPDNSDQQNCLLSRHQEELEQLPLDDMIKRISLLNNIGSIYSRQENFDMAMKCFNKAAKLYDQIQMSDRFYLEQLQELMGTIYFGMSRVYYRQENWSMSIYSLDKALDFILKQKKDNFLLAEIYHCLGLSYKHQWNITKAIYYFELAISTATNNSSHDHQRVQLYIQHLRQLKP